MLDDTLVIFGGEFSRTPTVELTGGGKSKLGRDHNPMVLVFGWLEEGSKGAPYMGRRRIWL